MKMKQQRAKEKQTATAEVPASESRAKKPINRRQPAQNAGKKRKNNQKS